MREADRRESIPIHVLIQSHIQPSDLVYLPANHIADCYCADAAVEGFEPLTRLSRGGRVVMTAGSGRDFFV
jgi:hypothetical protein